MKTRIIFISLLATLSQSLVAAEYFLIEKESFMASDSIDVCEKLVDNLNRFKDEEPMVCQRNLHSDFHEFSLPDWKLVDASEYIDEIERLLIKERINPWDNFEEAKILFLKGEIKVWHSTFDFNDDGKTNTVYRIRWNDNDQECLYPGVSYISTEGSPRYRYLVESNKNKSTKESGFIYVNGYILGDMFRYNGRSYFHMWSYSPPFVESTSWRYETPYPRVVLYESGGASELEERFYRKPICDIGYKE